MLITNVFDILSYFRKFFKQNSITKRIWFNEITKEGSKQYGYQYEKMCFLHKKLYIKSTKTIEYTWLKYSTKWSWLLWRQCMVARETKKIWNRFCTFCYKYVAQILPVQTFSISVEKLLIKLPTKKVSIKHAIWLKDISSCYNNLSLHINSSNNQKLSKQYQKLVDLIRWKNSVRQLQNDVISNLLKCLWQIFRWNWLALVLQWSQTRKACLGQTLFPQLLRSSF